jgi:hypothetical protein
MRDLGPDLLDWYQRTCQGDKPWLVRDGRTLTWWPYAFRQTVTAAVSRRSLDTDFTRVVAVTPISSAAPEDAPVEAILFGANVQASYSAMVFDPEARAFFTGTAACFHDGNERWLRSLFATGAALQVAIPHGLEPAAFETLGTPDLAVHPVSGRRLEPDDMLGLVDAVQARGREPNPLGPGAYATAARTLGELGVSARADGESLTLALPAEHLDGAFTVVLNNAEHPGFGNGLFVMQVAPPIPGAASLAMYANDLNRRELLEPVDMHSFGAWLRGPQGELNHVAFITADMLAMAGDGQAALMANLVFNEMTRARWLDDAWNSAAATA